MLQCVDSKAELLARLADADLSEDQVDIIFPGDSTGKCGVIELAKCIKSLYATYKKCKAKYHTLQGIEKCLKSAIGVKSACYPCLCRIMEHFFPSYKCKKSSA